MDYYSLKWMGDHLVMIDQRILPGEVKYLEYRDYQAVADAIRIMVVRGAPAIGAAAGYGMALAALSSSGGSVEELINHLQEASRVLIAARPTAVNLPWAVNRIMNKVRQSSFQSRETLQEAVVREAEAIFQEDLAANIQIGLNGLAVVPQNATVIHHCNTGALATTGYGTALGVIRTAHEHGKNIFAYVDETRPRLQGARLTSWELKNLGVPHKVIVDGAAAHVMRTRGVDLCLVGCDRVASNGDTANKIGKFHLSLAAYALGVRFYIVGPTSTIDMNIPDGDHIPVEERDADEITHIEGNAVAPAGIEVFNPAFDVTPARYITGIITEKGIAYPPFKQSLKALFS